MRLEIKAEARRDLKDIRDFSAAEFGPEIALNYLRDIRSSFERIRDFPGIGEESAISIPPLRVLPCRIHRIYYRADENAVTIIRILHKARNASRMF